MGLFERQKEALDEIKSAKQARPTAWRAAEGEKVEKVEEQAAYSVGELLLSHQSVAGNTETRDRESGAGS